MEREANRLIKVSFEGKTLRATENHPFYVPATRIWVPAEMLVIGDQLQSISGELLRIKTIEIEEGDFTVFNLSVR